MMNNSSSDFTKCPACDAKIRQKNVKKHLRKFHIGFVIQEKVKFKRVDKESELYIEEKLRIQELKKIDSKCFWIDKMLQTFTSSLFFELIEEKYDKLLKIITEYSQFNQKSINLSIKLQNEVLAYQKQRVNEILEKLSDFKTNKLSKEEFLSKKCRTINAYWDHLIFDRNKIKISTSLAYVAPIEMPGALRIYDEVKIEYFKRNYPKTIFKLIIYRNVIIEELSNGVSNLRSIISDHIADIEFSKRQKINKKGDS